MYGQFVQGFSRRIIPGPSDGLISFRFRRVNERCVPAGNHECKYWEFNFWILEMLLGTLVPMVLLLDEVIGAAVDGVRSRWPGVAIEMVVPDEAAAVRGDPVFVDRIITNLAENAARAVRGAADRRIQVVAARDADTVEVRVIDHGPGLAFGDLEMLFTPFYRLREGSSRLAAGLGLAICKGFVEAMGGAIAARDTPGGGTTISFRLAAA